MKRTSHRYICITRKGQEGLLCSEARSLYKDPQCTELGPGVVELSIAESGTFVGALPFFAMQVLPHAMPLSAPSVKTWAEAITERLIEHFGDEPPAWSLHVLDPATAETGKQYSRPKLIHEEVLALLRKKRRGLLKSLQTDVTTDSALVQVVLQSPSEGWISEAAPSVRRTLAPALSPFIAGYVDIPDDKRPPSRAFKKLKEAIAVFDLPVTRGMMCADLGACPGGWTFVLREHGCHVLAVDRSPLDTALMRDSKITFEPGDAFRWTPKKPVALMVCDVIASPDKTVSLIKRWVGEGLCHALCCTIKFKGLPDLDALVAVRSLLAAHCSRYGGKQLTHNKNELTVFGLLRN